MSKPDNAPVISLDDTKLIYILLVRNSIVRKRFIEISSDPRLCEERRFHYLQELVKEVFTLLESTCSWESLTQKGLRLAQDTDQVSKPNDGMGE